MRIIQIDLNKDYSSTILEAVKVLNSGGVIVYPTDTLYGLGANALNSEAVRRVFAIKQRSLFKPLPVIVKNMVWAKELVYLNQRNEEVLSKIWPGKVTAVLAKRDMVPDVVTAGSKNLGIRIPDYMFIDNLLGKFGYPLTSTSANISGDSGMGDINKIISTFEKYALKPDLIIDAGILPKSSPSTVLDLTTDKPKILRVGPSTPAQFLKLLEL